MGYLWFYLPVLQSSRIVNAACSVEFLRYSLIQLRNEQATINIVRERAREREIGMILTRSVPHPERGSDFIILVIATHKNKLGEIN